MATTTKRWTRWTNARGTTLEGIGGDERTSVYVQKNRWYMRGDEPYAWTISRLVKDPAKPLGAKLQTIAEGEEDTLPLARKAAEAWLEKESIADAMLAENAASKKNGGVPFWSDEALIQAFENEGVSHSDAIACVEGAKKIPQGAWLSANVPADRIRSDEEQAAIDRVELRLGDEPIGGRYPLLSRIASGEQAKIDEEIDRFDRRNERRSEERPFVPAWRRRELERLERGESAGKELGIADEPIALDDDEDPDRIACAREGHPGGYGEEPVVCLRCGQAIPERRFSRRSLEQAGASVSAPKEIVELAVELDVPIFLAGEVYDAESRYARTGLTGDAEKAVAKRAEVVERAAAAEARSIEVLRTARQMGVSPDKAARILDRREADADVAFLERERARLGPDAALPEHWGSADIREARIRSEAADAARRAGLR